MKVNLFDYFSNPENKKHFEFMDYDPELSEELFASAFGAGSIVYLVIAGELRQVEAVNAGEAEIT